MDENATIAAAKDDDEIVLSEAMKQEIIEREKHIEQHPDCWIDYEQAIKELREL